MGKGREKTGPEATGEKCEPKSCLREGSHGQGQGSENGARL